MKAFVYFCIFCRIGRAIKNAFESIVDALKKVADFVTDLAEEVLQYIFDKILGPIIEKVIEPILKPVFNFFSDVLKKVLSVFFEIFEKFLQAIVEPILEIVLRIVNELYAELRYMLMLGLLKIIDFLEKAFNIFAGITNVKYEGKENFLLNVFFTNNAINKVFWGVTVLAVAVTFIFTIIAVLQSMADTEAKRPVGKVLKYMFKSMLTMLIVPFACLVVVNLSSMVLRSTNDALSLTNGISKNPSLGTMTYLTFTMDAAIDDYYNQNPSMLDGLRADYITGKKTYFMDGRSDFDIGLIHYSIVNIVALFMMVIIVICSIVFIVKMFELMILYVTAPFFAAAIVLDEGAKFKEWCEMFVAKLVSGVGMVIVLKLFFLVVPIVLTNQVKFSSLPLVNLIIQSSFMLGGLYAVYKSGNLITQIVNINAAYAEAGISSDVLNKVISQAVKYGTMAAKAVATGGASLSTDVTSMAIGAATSATGKMGNLASEGEKDSKGGSGNAFKGENYLGAHRDSRGGTDAIKGASQGGNGGIGNMAKMSSGK